MLSTYPILPELAKEIESLKRMVDELAENVGSASDSEELLGLEKKLKIC